MKEQMVLNVAKYIIENTATVDMTAAHFDLSVRTIQNYINKDLILIDKDIYDNVKETQKKLEQIGRLAGSKTGKRGPKYNDFECMEIAEVMIENSMTLDDASIYFNIPRSSIYDKVKGINDPNIQEKLEELFINNKKRS